MGGFGGWGAGGAVAAKGDFGAVDVGARGEGKGGLEGAGIVNGNVGNVTAGFAVEVGVILKIRAVAGGRAVEVHLTDEAAVGEGFEAVVNRGEGDPGDFLLHAHEDLGGSGVVALGGEDFKNLTPLLGETEFGAEREAAFARRSEVGSIREILTGHGRE